MKEIFNRMKFEHIFSFALFIGLMVAMIFGMQTGNNDLVDTAMTIINVGLGTVIGYFFNAKTNKGSGDNDINS